MTIRRMDNVLIVVDDLEAAKAFFIELGLKLEGETTVEGPSVGSLIGLEDVRATLAMMRRLGLATMGVYVGFHAAAPSRTMPYDIRARVTPPLRQSSWLLQISNERDPRARKAIARMEIVVPTCTTFCVSGDRSW